MELQTMPLRTRVWDNRRQLFLHEDCYSIFSDGSIEVNEVVTFSDGCDTVITVDSYDYPNRFIISQDTGLKDKNGKSIFSGDVIEVDENFNWGNGDNERHYFGDVVNHQGCWCVNSICGDEELMQPLYEIRTEDMEVTGNIWQTPELLEKE